MHPYALVARISQCVDRPELSGPAKPPAAVRARAGRRAFSSHDFRWRLLPESLRWRPAALIVTVSGVWAHFSSIRCWPAKPIISRGTSALFGVCCELHPPRRFRYPAPPRYAQSIPYAVRRIRFSSRRAPGSDRASSAGAMGGFPVMKRAGVSIHSDAAVALPNNLTASARTRSTRCSSFDFALPTFMIMVPARAPTDHTVVGFLYTALRPTVASQPICTVLGTNCAESPRRRYDFSMENTDKGRSANVR